MSLEQKIDLLLRKLSTIEERTEDWMPDEDVMHLLNYKKRSLANLEKEVRSGDVRRKNKKVRIWRKSAIINLCK